MDAKKIITFALATSMSIGIGLSGMLVKKKIKKKK